MSKYAVTAGVQDSPVKTVLYGPEGIGKSTFASHFPNPVFIDTEGGTKRLNVARLPQPTSWAMLLDEVAEVRKGSIPCGTLVIDTADWAERLCIQAVCAKAKVNGIEDFGYGKGYTYVKEEFGKLLDALEEVLQAGHNVVVLAHAAITKFEQPDAVGNYDRWSMKTSKQVAPLLREWCDMLLFANYKTVVEKVSDGKNAKSKASGGRRVLYTAHHPCWDAKNRFDLPEEVPFDYASIAACIPGSSAQKAPSQRELAAKQTEGVPVPKAEADILPSQQQEAKPVAQPQPAPLQESSEKNVLLSLGVPEKLAALMSANKVSCEELQGVVGKRGYFPEDMDLLQPCGRHRTQGCQYYCLSLRPRGVRQHGAGQAAGYHQAAGTALCGAGLLWRQERPRHREGGCPGLRRVPQACGLSLFRLPEKRPDHRPAEPQPFPPFPDARHPAR